MTALVDSARNKSPRHFPTFADAQEYLAQHEGGDPFDYARDNPNTMLVAAKLGVGEQVAKAIELSRTLDPLIGASVDRAIRASRALDDEAPRIVALEVAELLARDFPPQEALLEPWARRQNLIMVHAKRGVGKTHFALGVAYAVASGGAFLKWRAPAPRKVLYIDGEMPGPGIKDRLAALVAAHDEEPPEGYLRVITPDVQDRPLPDLATMRGQAAFEPVLGDAELIVVDNLSSLTRTGAENEGESWLPVAEWALARRREGRAVLFVHHSGKGGAQRGTSRREDLLDVVIRLDHAADYNPEQGASFRIMFEKARGIFGEDVRELEATLATDPHGAQSWSWREAEGATLDRVVGLHKLDMSQGEIATELGVNRSTVCRALQKAKRDGLIQPGARL